MYVFNVLIVNSKGATSRARYEHSDRETAQHRAHEHVCRAQEFADWAGYSIKAVVEEVA